MYNIVLKFGNVIYHFYNVNFYFRYNNLEKSSVIHIDVSKIEISSWIVNKLDYLSISKVG